MSAGLELEEGEIEEGEIPDEINPLQAKPPTPAKEASRPTPPCSEKDRGGVASKPAPNGGTRTVQSPPRSVGRGSKAGSRLGHASEIVANSVQRGRDSRRGSVEPGEEAGEIIDGEPQGRASSSLARGRASSPGPRAREQRRSPLPDRGRRRSPTRKQYSPRQDRSPRRRQYSPETLRSSADGTRHNRERRRSTSRRRALPSSGTPDRAARRPGFERDRAGEGREELRTDRLTRHATSSTVAAAETPEELARRKAQRLERDIADCIEEFMKATAAVGVPDVIKSLDKVCQNLKTAERKLCQLHKLYKEREQTGPNASLELAVLGPRLLTGFKALQVFGTTGKGSETLRNKVSAKDIIVTAAKDADILFTGFQKSEFDKTMLKSKVFCSWLNLGPSPAKPIDRKEDEQASSSILDAKQANGRIVPSTHAQAQDGLLHAATLVVAQRPPASEASFHLQNGTSSVNREAWLHSAGGAPSSGHTKRKSEAGAANVHEGGKKRRITASLSDSPPPGLGISPKAYPSESRGGPFGDDTAGQSSQSSLRSSSADPMDDVADALYDQVGDELPIGVGPSEDDAVLPKFLRSAHSQSALLDSAPPSANSTHPMHNDASNGYESSQLRAPGNQAAVNAVQQSEPYRHAGLPPGVDALLRKGRLCLVLDLDHTLVNSARYAECDQAVMAPVERYLAEEAHLPPERRTLFKLDHIQMYTKLRPSVREFLRRAASLWELWIHTNGTRTYANAIRDLLDPTRELFGDRIITNSASAEAATANDLAKTFTQGLEGRESVSVIVDDSASVWAKHSANLLEVERYVYFPSSARSFGIRGRTYLELRRDEHEQEGMLMRTLKTLERVHAHVFAAMQKSQDPHAWDVRRVLHEARHKVLKGVRILFTHVIPLETKQHDHKFWRMAERFGATCTTHATPDVTHVVAGTATTAKAAWAAKNGKFVVSSHWLECSCTLWEHADERRFPPPSSQPSAAP